MVVAAKSVGPCFFQIFLFEQITFHTLNTQSSNTSNRGAVLEEYRLDIETVDGYTFSFTIDEDDQLKDSDDVANEFHGFRNVEAIQIWVMTLVSDGLLASFERTIISDNILGNRSSIGYTRPVGRRRRDFRQLKRNVVSVS